MDMAKGNSKVLTAEQELQLRQPIEDYVGKIQAQIDSLRVEGTDKVIFLLTFCQGTVSLQPIYTVLKGDNLICTDRKSVV